VQGGHALITSPSGRAFHFTKRCLPKPKMRAPSSHASGPVR
jgi:hypothetical protein